MRLAELFVLCVDHASLRIPQLPEHDKGALTLKYFLSSVRILGSSYLFHIQSN